VISFVRAQRGKNEIKPQAILKQYVCTQSVLNMFKICVHADLWETEMRPQSFGQGKVKEHRWEGVGETKADYYVSQHWPLGGAVAALILLIKHFY
jgi:hypothetical protein